MNKVRVAIVALGLALGVMAGVPIAEAVQKINIHCDECTCNADLSSCECTNCTLTPA